MNRATAVTAALATGAMVAAVTIAPAMAAARPAAAHPAAHVTSAATHAKAYAKAHAKAQPAIRQAKAVAARARVIAQQAQRAASPPVVIGSEEDNGTYVTVVTCQGTDTPPPITLGKPGTPLTASGIGPSAGILKSLQKPNPYKTIYTCTVVVKMKVPPKPKPTTKKATKPTTKPTAKSTKPKHAPRPCQFTTGTGGSGSGPGGGTGSSGKAGSGEVCTKPVTVNTGFGGLAPQVTMHHPAG